MRCGIIVVALLVLCAAAVEFTTPQVGNGYVATFVNTTDVFVAGVFNGNGSNSQRAAFPATSRIFVSGAESLDGGYDQSLVDATVSLSYNNGNVFAKHQWYAHRTVRNLLVEEIKVTTRTFGNLSVPLVDLGITGGNPSDYDGTTVVNTTLMNILGQYLVANVTLYKTVAPEWPQFFGQISVCSAAIVAPSSIQVVGSNGYLLLVTAYCTNLPGDEGTSDPCGCAVSKVQYAYASEKELKKSHDAAWKDLWSHRILFTAAEESSSSAASSSTHFSSGSGPTDQPSTMAPSTAAPTPVPTEPYMANASVLQDVVDASFYAILSSMRDDFPYSSSPGGLSTNGYRGHTFWDMETWMMPNLLLFYPNIAKGSAIDYRLNRLPGAANNAVSEAGGKDGYAFPWESALSGFPVCPWPQGATSELHITADIVGGWRMHYYLSGDVQFLSSAFPAINGTAAFWLSRATKNTDGSWSINGVTPPDEYHFGNDSVYTNFAVQTVVNFALDAAKTLNISLPAPYAASLADFASKITILYNKTGNFHPEFAGYTGDLVKQADVVMLNYPWGMPMHPSTIKGDLDYYGPRTDPFGPAMTWSMFSVGHLSIGDTATAMYYFLNGFQNNAFPPYYAWYEVAGGSGCPNFITGAGGFLQSVWAGLTGLRVEQNKLIITTSAYLPSTIGEIKLQNIFFQGSQVSIKLIRIASNKAISVRVRLEQAGPTALVFNNIPLQSGFEIVTVLKTDLVLTTA